MTDYCASIISIPSLLGVIILPLAKLLRSLGIMPMYF